MRKNQIFYLLIPVLGVFFSFLNPAQAQQVTTGKYVVKNFFNYKCPAAGNQPRPFGITFDSKNQMFMLCGDNSGNNFVFKVNPNGTYTEITRMRTNFSGPGIDIDQNDNIVVATGQKMFRISQDGKMETLFSDFRKAGDVKIDNKGNMYVIDFSKYTIYKITPNLERTVWVDNFDGTYPEYRNGGIEFDPKFENLLVCDCTGKKVTSYHINDDGTAGETKQLLEKKYTFWAAYGPRNSIFFTDWTGSRILRLGSDNTVEIIPFGKVPLGITAGKGEFGEDTLYVTDNDGVKKVFWEETTGINNLEDNPNGMNIFPNPASTKVSLKCQKEIEKIQLFDAASTLKMEFTNIGDKQRDIDVSELNPGVYIMSVTFDDQLKGSRKLIKE
jgi:hypothetical protein